jgi:hypothetical protein
MDTPLAVGGLLAASRNVHAFLLKFIDHSTDRVKGMHKRANQDGLVEPRRQTEQRGLLQLAPQCRHGV